MTALGPRTLKAIAEGMPFHSAGIGTPIPMESMQDFARRVAMIAHEEGFAVGARAQREAFVDELLEADATWSVKDAQVLADNAMQRVAPLVGGEK